MKVVSQSEAECSVEWKRYLDRAGVGSVQPETWCEQTAIRSRLQQLTCMSLHVWRGRVNTNENRLAQQAPPARHTYAQTHTHTHTQIHTFSFRCRAARLGPKTVLKATSVLLSPPPPPP